ncbi:nitrate reductase molybdenum cofactor assembly chaperone [Actinorugispora endophytica]|uniref:Respiratory nitrate reductase chaperone NarJ n=1 Tax=Actinorugispora endophytica TaxID=1605990 RepID=A0A4R6UZY6_9ACTN|nr:nitrate reductase molybdenum cofactor assembly chaperone [Actinorugispora endophytica]TDQ52975.1 respiratory nitrate reductase chaperone NarJ [Actinorugispora endophytica]
MRLRRRASRAEDSGPDPRTRAVLRRAASLLIGYPDARFYEHLPIVRQALADLPESGPRDALLAFCAHAEAEPALDLGAHYVHTFDTRRRRALHMTYYTDGDTRRRGHALARVKEIYAGCGWELDPGELPDHLAVVLEFAAIGDAEWGEALLVRFQPGLELLRAGLHETGTPYADVLDAIGDTLPPPGKEEREAALRLAELGPPAEDVGLDAYGKPVDLGMPGVGAPAATAGGRR